MPIRPGSQAGGLLDLAQQQVQPDHVAGVGDLGQHDDVQAAPGGLDHLDHVTVGPPGSCVVDPHRAGLAAPAAGVQRRDHAAPGRLLGRRGDRVLQIEEHLVGGQAAGLVQEPGAAARHRQAGPAGPVLLRHLLPASCLSWHPEPVTAYQPDTGLALIAEATKRAGLIWITVAGRRAPARLAHLAGRGLRGDRPGRAGRARARGGRPGHRQGAEQGHRRLPGVLDRAGEPGGARLPRSGAIIGALLAGRLNEPAAAPAERWAAHGNVYRLTPQ